MFRIITSSPLIDKHNWTEEQRRMCEFLDEVKRNSSDGMPQMVNVDHIVKRMKFKPGPNHPISILARR